MPATTDLLTRTAQLLVEHLAVARRAERPAIPYAEPEALLAHYRAFTGDAAALLADVIARSTAVHHPGYVGHQVAVPHEAAIAASWVSDVLNNGSAVYEMGMAANAIERVVVERLAEAFGLPDTASGIMTSGGSLANLTAMLAARAAHVHHPRSADAAAVPPRAEDLCVLVSDQAHYCIDRAVHIMGWGDGGIVELATDADFRVGAGALEQGLAEAERRGRTPIALVGMACSTSTGTYDDLDRLGAFAAAHGLWFHVDAAHGGAARFSDSERHLVRGIERADSIALDAHKMMRTPALTTVLLYARAADSYRTFRQRADYLWGGDAAGDWEHGGQRTVECTKLMMGLRVMALLREGGLDEIGAYVAGRHALARAFAALVREQPGWEVAAEPMSNIVCFRHVPPHLREPGAVDAHNAGLRARLRADGRWYVVNTTLRGVYWLRVALMHPDTQLAGLKGMLAFAEGPRRFTADRRGGAD